MKFSSNLYKLSVIRYFWGKILSIINSSRRKYLVVIKVQKIFLTLLRCSVFYKWTNKTVKLEFHLWQGRGSCNVGLRQWWSMKGKNSQRWEKKKHILSYYLSLTNSLLAVNNLIFLLSSLCGLNLDYDFIESWQRYHSPIKTTNVLQ